MKVKPFSRVRLFATPWTVAHGIFQARVLEWVAISFSRGPSRPRDQTWVSLFRQRLCFSEGWKYSEVDCGGGHTSKNAQPSRHPVLTRHTHRTRFPSHHPPWTSGLGGEHVKGQKAKGSGEGGEARRNGKPGRSHRGLGLNPSPVGYKLCDLSQLLSLSEPRFPRQQCCGR